MQTASDLAAAVDQCESPDFDLLRVWADQLEEDGDERAEGVRWAADNGRWPYTNDKSYSWWTITYRWRHSNNYLSYDRFQSIRELVPDGMRKFYRYKDEHQEFAIFPNYSQCFLALGTVYHLTKGQ